MNTIALIYTLVVASFIGEPTNSEISQIEEDMGIIFFEGSWQEALNKAREENKFIFLDAYASWCGPCKAMQKKVFPSEELGAYFNANFINVKIDMEKGEGTELAKKYAVRAYPSLYFIDQYGKVVTYAVGYHSSNKLLKLGEAALK